MTEIVPPYVLARIRLRRLFLAEIEQAHREGNVALAHLLEDLYAQVRERTATGGGQ